MGANERIRLAIIGSGNRGQYLMRSANHAGGITWTAICDAWDQRRQQAAALAGDSPRLVADYRRVLEANDVDAVVVATWDHLHAPIAAEACHAGKDVFVEKPMTSLPMQGHELVRAVREANRIVQVGVQQRSMSNFIEAKQRFFDTGAIGSVHMVRTIWNGNTGYFTPVPPGMDRKPDGLDWQKCLGWLPKIPWDPMRYFNRFAYWDISTGGQTGGLFVHMIDVVHWYLGLRQPKAAVAVSGIYKYNDGRDTPDNVNLALEYPEKVNVTFEASLTDTVRKETADIVFLGTGGRLHIFRGGYRFIPADTASAEVRGPGGDERTHMANWLECIRSRKQPSANVVDGHYGAMACHIGNIADREKRRVEWRPEWDV
jgi:predicted dehydrogenase